MSNRTIETFRNWLGSKEATAQLAYLRERCEHGVSGECGRCKDDAAYRLALHTVHAKLQDQGDRDLWDSWLTVYRRICEQVEF